MLFHLIRIYEKKNHWIYSLSIPPFSILVTDSYIIIKKLYIFYISQFNFNVISKGSRRFWYIFSCIHFLFTLTNQKELAPLINYSSKNNPFRSIKIAVTYKLTCFVYTLRDWFIWRLICPCTLLFVRIKKFH